MKVTTTRVDVADRVQVEAWAQQVVADHGRVNLIFNNAGVALGSTVEDMSYADFEWLMGINFWGVVYGTKAFLPLLKASGEGHIINTSIVFGLAGIPSQSAYNAAKFAVRGFTESLRQELDMQGAPVSATRRDQDQHRQGGADGSVDRQHRTGSRARQGEVREAFITTPESAARKILKAVRGNRRRVLVGADAYLIDWIVRLMPASYKRLTMFFTRHSL